MCEVHFLSQKKIGNIFVYFGKFMNKNQKLFNIPVKKSSLKLHL